MRYYGTLIIVSHVSKPFIHYLDYSSGFGGKFGVQKDRQDQSAVGYEHTEKLSQHASQKDHSSGFGGKFGVQTDRKDEVGYQFL